MEDLIREYETGAEQLKGRISQLQQEIKTYRQEIDHKRHRMATLQIELEDMIATINQMQRSMQGPVRF